MIRRQLTKQEAEEYLSGPYQVDGPLGKIGQLLTLAREDKEGQVLMSKDALKWLDESYDHRISDAPTLPELVRAISDGKMRFNTFYLSSDGPTPTWRDSTVALCVERCKTG